MPRLNPMRKIWRKAAVEKSEIMKTNPISPQSLVSKTDTIISTASTSAKSSSFNNCEDTLVDSGISTIKSVALDNTQVDQTGPKSPSILSYNSLGWNTSKNNPPYPNSYEEMLRLLYTNDRASFFKHLDSSFENFFCCLANVSFLDFQSNEIEVELFDSMVIWILDRNLVRSLFDHPKWNSSHVCAHFVKILLLKLEQKQISLCRKSFSKDFDLKQIISEEELLCGVLKWTRSTNVATSRPTTPFKKTRDSLLLKDKIKLGEILTLIKFNEIPKQKLFEILENHIPTESFEPEFSITQETMKEIIRVAWQQYDPPKQTKPMKWIQNIKDIFNKK